MRYYTQKEIRDKNKRIDRNKEYLMCFMLGVLFSGLSILSYIGLLTLLYFIKVTGGVF